MSIPLLSIISSHSAGLSMRENARLHGCSASYVHRVISGASGKARIENERRVEIIRELLAKNTALAQQLRYLASLIREGGRGTKADALSIIATALERYEAAP